MYFYLKGKVSLHQKNSIVLEVNNIGYQIFVSHPDDYPLLEECLVYTVFYVREDEQFLVGFKTFEEKMLYSKLVQVKGVGPKTAINILGAAKLEELIDAINNSNLLFLKSLEGVGPKTASQIILDLKGKISFESSISGDKNLDDAIEGLKSFGFSIKEIKEVLKDVRPNSKSVEEYISLALKRLNTNR